MAFVVKNVCAFGVVLGMVVAVIGCGNSDDSNAWGGTTTVREISCDSASVPLDDGAVFRVNFSFDEEDVFNDQGEVHLVMRLPPQLEYRSGSAEIDGISSRDDDGVDPTVVQCRGAETYLSFTLTRYDLDQADAPTDDADAQLKLTLNGKRLGAQVVVEAAADDGDVLFGCQVPFNPDEQEVISVR